MTSNQIVIKDSVINIVGGDQVNTVNETPVPLSSSVVTDQIKESIAFIQNEPRNTREKQDHARLCVYRVLSMHPALERMKPQSQELGDLDWYTELGTPLLNFTGLFRRLGETDHFQRTANLGEQGRRARIMMLLCWVIGHRLPKDKIMQLVSTAVEDGLTNAQNCDNVDSLLQLHLVRGVLDHFVTMIKTRLPLPKERNPFYGEDFVAQDEDKAIPRAELWPYREGPEEGLFDNERYEFDVKRNPTILLRPLIGRVIVPQTKLSLLMIQWVTRNFALGKKVFCRNDIDTTAFWNADPPSEASSSLKDSDLMDLGVVNQADHVDGVTDDSASDGCDFSMADGDSDGPMTIFDAFQELPLEDWVHLRFCLTYFIHDWAHDRFVRSLLFSQFCHRQSLPSLQDALNTIPIAKWLREKLGRDVCSLLESLFLADGMQKWGAITGDSGWTLDFGTIGRDGRAMTVIFANASHHYLEPDSNSITTPVAFHELFSFLTDPALYCPTEPDIVEITSQERGLTGAPDIPDLDPSTCTCGMCVRLHHNLCETLDNFQMRFPFLVSGSDSTMVCGALERAWDGVMTRAEEWMDTYLDRIDCPLHLFPFTLERRLGIAIMAVLFTLNLKIGATLNTKQLLTFVSFVRFCHVSPDTFIQGPAEQSDTSNDFAIIAPADPDDEESLDVLSTTGGWLYDIAGGGMEGDQDATIYFIPASAKFKIHYRSSPILEIRPIHMPSITPTTPVIIPPDHSTLDAPEVSPSSKHVSPIADVQVEPVIMDLSDDSADGFPVLANSNGHDGPAGCSIQDITFGGFGAQLTTFYCGRLVRTWWMPRVEVGQPCVHSDAYGRMTRCALTSRQVLLQIRPDTSQVDTHADQHGCHASSPAEEVAHFFRYHKHLTAHLTERQGPFERGRLCIVRCGDDEGPVDPLIILAASFGMKVYVFHYRECWNCACSRMITQRCSLGIVTTTKVVTECAHCIVADRRAERIAAGFSQ